MSRTNESEAIDSLSQIDLPLPQGVFHNDQPLRGRSYLVLLVSMLRDVFGE